MESAVDLLNDHAQLEHAQHFVVSDMRDVASGTLGIPTMAYLPFAFFNIAAPLMSLLLGFTGFKIERMQPADAKAETAPIT